MALSKDEILNAVAELTVMELVDLIAAFEEKFGVSAAAATVAAGPAAAARAPVGPADTPSAPAARRIASRPAVATPRDCPSPRPAPTPAGR